MPRCIRQEELGLERHRWNSAMPTTRSRRSASGSSRPIRLHTIYKPKGWATITGSFSDRERHNNTNNNAGFRKCSRRCELQRPHQPRRLQPDRQRGCGTGAEREILLRCQLLLQRRVCGDQHLLHQRERPQQRRRAGRGNGPSTGAPNLCVGNATWFARDFMACADAVRFGGTLVHPDHPASVGLRATRSAP